MEALEHVNVVTFTDAEAEPGTETALNYIMLKPYFEDQPYPQCLSGCLTSPDRWGIVVPIS